MRGCELAGANEKGFAGCARQRLVGAVSELLAAPSRARRARMSEAWMRSKLRPNTSDNERLMLQPHAGDQQQTPPSEFDPGLEAARFFSLDGQVAKTHRIR